MYNLRQKYILEQGDLYYQHQKARATHPDKQKQLNNIHQYYCQKVINKNTVDLTLTAITHLNHTLYILIYIREGYITLLL